MHRGQGNAALKVTFPVPVCFMKGENHEKNRTYYFNDSGSTLYERMQQN